MILRLILIQVFLWPTLSGYRIEESGHYLILFNGEAVTLHNPPVKTGMFLPSSEKIVLIHGAEGNATKVWYKDVTAAYLSSKTNLYHVIQIDWSQEKRLSGDVTRTIRNIGKKIGEFLMNLAKAEDFKVGDYHLVAHSTGCHVAGSAGKHIFENAGHRVGRITALDASNSAHMDLSYGHRIKKGDAKIVVGIHTDGYGTGIGDPYGDVDFFPNGGNNQPGCIGDVWNYFIDFCSHQRSYQYWEEAVLKDRFSGIRCESWEHFENGTCNNNKILDIVGKIRKKDFGSYFTRTNSKTPFLIDAPLAKENTQVLEAETQKNIESRVKNKNLYKKGKNRTAKLGNSSSDRINKGLRENIMRSEEQKTISKSTRKSSKRKSTKFIVGALVLDNDTIETGQKMIVKYIKNKNKPDKKKLRKKSRSKSSSEIEDDNSSEESMDQSPLELHSNKDSKIQGRSSRNNKIRVESDSTSEESNSRKQRESDATKIGIQNENSSEESNEQNYHKSNMNQDKSTKTKNKNSKKDKHLDKDVNLNISDSRNEESDNPNHDESDSNGDDIKTKGKKLRGESNSNQDSSTYMEVSNSIEEEALKKEEVVSNISRSSSEGSSDQNQEESDSNKRTEESDSNQSDSTKIEDADSTKEKPGKEDEVDSNTSQSISGESNNQVHRQLNSSKNIEDDSSKEESDIIQYNSTKIEADGNISQSSSEDSNNPNHDESDSNKGTEESDSNQDDSTKIEDVDSTKKKSVKEDEVDSNTSQSISEESNNQNHRQLNNSKNIEDENSKEESDIIQHNSTKIEADSNISQSISEDSNNPNHDESDSNKGTEESDLNQEKNSKLKDRDSREEKLSEEGEMVSNISQSNGEESNNQNHDELDSNKGIKDESDLNQYNNTEIEESNNSNYDESDLNKGKSTVGEDDNSEKKSDLNQNNDTTIEDEVSRRDESVNKEIVNSNISRSNSEESNHTNHDESESSNGEISTIEDENSSEVFDSNQDNSTKIKKGISIKDESINQEEVYGNTSRPNSEESNNPSHDELDSNEGIQIEGENSTKISDLNEDHSTEIEGGISRTDESINRNEINSNISQSSSEESNNPNHDESDSNKGIQIEDKKPIEVSDLNQDNSTNIEEGISRKDESMKQEENMSLSSRSRSRNPGYDESDSNEGNSIQTEAEKSRKESDLSQDNSTEIEDGDSRKEKQLNKEGIDSNISQSNSEQSNNSNHDEIDSNKGIEESDLNQENNTKIEDGDSEDNKPMNKEKVDSSISESSFRSESSELSREEISLHNEEENKKTDLLEATKEVNTDMNEEYDINTHSPNEKTTVHTDLNEEKQENQSNETDFESAETKTETGMEDSSKRKYKKNKRIEDNSLYDEETMQSDTEMKKIEKKKLRTQNEAKNRYNRKKGKKMEPESNFSKVKKTGTKNKDDISQELSHFGKMSDTFEFIIDTMLDYEKRTQNKTKRTKIDRYSESKNSNAGEQVNKMLEGDTETNTKDKNANRASYYILMKIPALQDSQIKISLEKKLRQEIVSRILLNFNDLKKLEDNTKLNYLYKTIPINAINSESNRNDENEPYTISMMILKSNVKLKGNHVLTGSKISKIWKDKRNKAKVRFNRREEKHEYITLKSSTQKKNLMEDNKNSTLSDTDEGKFKPVEDMKKKTSRKSKPSYHQEESNDDSDNLLESDLKNKKVYDSEKTGSKTIKDMNNNESNIVMRRIANRKNTPSDVEKEGIKTGGDIKKETPVKFEISVRRKDSKEMNSVSDEQLKSTKKKKRIYASKKTGFKEINMNVSRPKAKNSEDVNEKTTLSEEDKPELGIEEDKFKPGDDMKKKNSRRSKISVEEDSNEIISEVEDQPEGNLKKEKKNAPDKTGLKNIEEIKKFKETNRKNTHSDMKEDKSKTGDNMKKKKSGRSKISAHDENRNGNILDDGKLENEEKSRHLR